jgi:hypothetical protein
MLSFLSERGNTMEDKIITQVVFRKWKDANKDVIALFPEDIYDGVGSNFVRTKLCMSYMHLGQHSSADYHYVVSVSVTAKPEEYKELKKELEQIGYRLNVRQRK